MNVSVPLPTAIVTILWCAAEHVDRRPSPSIAENMDLGWRVLCGLLVETPVCLWPLSGRGHENRVPFAS